MRVNTRFGCFRLEPAQHDMGFPMRSGLVRALFPTVGLSFVTVLLACSSTKPFDPVQDAGGIDASVDTGPGLVARDDASSGVLLDGGGVVNDGAPTADRESCALDGSAGPGPVPRVCVQFGTDTNECDGYHDLPGFPANGTGGNGFDDNCNGLVDEGCSCDNPGSTKECFLVPASQTAFGKPVGWCGLNSRGTVDCIKRSAEFPPEWSGQCRGAQPPFADDICAAGDFDCDGKELNSRTQDCACKPGEVQCPTSPLETVPFPDVNNLPLKVDATGWFTSALDVAQAQNWKWKLRGGDCDNIIPHPTFALYRSNVATGPLGQQRDDLGLNSKEHGIEATGGSVGPVVYPAFSLSGDYILEGEFELYGQTHSCTVKIQVRAPGIRAEACWDTMGGFGMGVDLDLHVAKLNGMTCPQKQGWSGTCAKQDCYYANCKGTGSSNPNWFPPSPASACSGWGSANSGTSCGNPRLDKDIINCNSGETDPGATTGFSPFCGPENINIDAPADGDRYAIGLKYYGGTRPSKGHVNVYCNGERIVSAGFNPVTGVDFPVLTQAGADENGDLWKVGVVTAQVQGGQLSCSVQTSPSQNPRATTDGTTANCVDNASSDTADSVRLFTPSGLTPADATALCFH